FYAIWNPLFFFPTGVKCQSLESIPSSAVMKKPGETLSLSCKGSGFAFSSFSMYWVRQPTGKALEWMGVIWYDARGTDYGSSFKGRFTISRDSSNVLFLDISRLEAGDTAVYYCARRHSGADGREGRSKTTLPHTTITAQCKMYFIRCGREL
uniref:Ig-like domain-containing protein n=1 Tax=Denticeps clupeoides TaxID=299321 RepID=A0AAY4BRI9_9TELE